MKQAYVHVFYLAVIAFLGYNYWSSVQAFKAFEHLNKQLNVDYSILEDAAGLMHRDIQRNRKFYPTPILNRHADMAEKITNATATLIEFINANKTKFVQLNNGFDMPNNKDSINNPNSTSTSKFFFTEAKIKEIKGKLSQFSTILMDSISNPNDKTMLLEQVGLPLLTDNNDFWQLIKTLPANAILAELASIKNKIKVDEIALLNYYVSQTTFCGVRFDAYKTDIAPKKAVLIEGESFDADVFLTAFSSDIRSNVIFKVNEEVLDINQGVAHFKGKKESVGTKTFKATATIKNPLTGQVTTAESIFQYEVLPKCKRDCP